MASPAAVRSVVVFSPEARASAADAWFYTITNYFGLQSQLEEMARFRVAWADDTDVPATLRLADRLGLLEGRCDFGNATYFLSQITIVPGDARGLSRWRKNLFLTMAHNAASPVEYFRLPDNRTVTIGERIAL